MLPTGRHHRYDWLIKSGLSVNLPKLSRRKIGFIEQAEFLAPGEKLELLELLMHLKFTTEISIKYQPEAKLLLDKLGLPWFINSYHHSKKGLIKWLQVSANPQIDKFIQKHSKDMSVIEAGVLYNYPIPAVLAFANLLERNTKKPKNLLGWYYGKVHSQDFYQEEYKEYQRRLNVVKKVSPRVYQGLQHFLDQPTI
ncbi:hypothetical protein KKB83_03425 [Patescibacteria group bacterium]|nr:hypothetical protein [Patescibacteria group bacterium]